MGIRIEKIDINRHGPLDRDFNFEPGDLNLIYGHNESGKTCIVEAMVRMLFRTGVNTPWILKKTKLQEPAVRRWNSGGKIKVSGLESNVTVFTPGSGKLEDCSVSGVSFPEELSRLMVVRAGDTRLSATSNRKGDSILRTCISGKGVLDEIEKNIKHESVKNAVIEKGIIQADNKGLISDRIKASKEVERLEALLIEVDENASLSAVNSLERTVSMLAEQLSDLEFARRHRAFILDRKLRGMKQAMENLPSEKKIIDILAEIGLLRIKMENKDDIERRLGDSTYEEDNYIWINKAREEYLAHSEITNGKYSKGKICDVMLFAFIAATVIAGFFSKPLPIVFASGALLCLILRIIGRDESVSSLTVLRREKLEKEFGRRFQRELTDSAVLEVECRKLETEQLRLNNLSENLGSIEHEIVLIKERILSQFYIMTGEKVPYDRWDAEIENIRKRREEVREAIISQEALLSALNVTPDSYLSDPVSVEWDQKLYRLLKDKLDTVSKRLEREKHDIEILKAKIAAAMGKNTPDIRLLLSALEDRRTDAADTCKELTARILAENQVYRAVSEYRAKDNARLEEALESPTVISPLYRITGHYSGLKMDGDGYLILTTPEGEEFPLEQLSTGAAEQIYVSLRTAFAELSLGGTAFLILDDAFQHSDWERRRNLVGHVMELVNSGWQVFYFTMDDNLKELFDGSGKELNGRTYKSISLD